MFKLRINLCLICFIGLVSFQAISQEPDSILIYSHNNDYLLPIIEKSLKDLRKINGEKVFNKVTNLNRAYDNRNVEISLNILLGYYLNLGETKKKENKLPGRDSRGKKIQKEIAFLLTKHQYFLLIKQNTLLSLIEYQFFLFPTSSILEHIDSNEQELPLFPTTDITNIYNAGNFFIDPVNDNYEYIIENEIKKLFPDTNFPPTPKISINGLANSKDRVYYFSEFDTIELGSFLSTDTDTPRKNFKYYWRQIDLNGNVNVPYNQRVYFDENGNNIKFNLKTQGNYAFGLILNDGISNSIEDTVYINIIKKPIIKTNKPYSVIYITKQIFKSNLNYDFEVKDDYQISVSNPQDLDNTELIVGKKSARFGYYGTFENGLEYSNEETSETNGNDYYSGIGGIRYRYEKSVTGFKLELDNELDSLNEEIYVYSVTHGVKSNSIRITHNAFVRGFFNLYLGNSFNSLEVSKVFNSSTKKDTISLPEIYIGGGFYIFRYLELGGYLFINLNNQPTILENVDIDNFFLEGRLKVIVPFIKEYNVPVVSFGLSVGIRDYLLRTRPNSWEHKQGFLVGCSMEMMLSFKIPIYINIGFDYNLKSAKYQNEVLVKKPFGASIGVRYNLFASKYL